MDFFLRRPAARHSFRETVNFVPLFEYLSQIARLVEGLLDVLLLEMGRAVDSASQLGPVVADLASFFEAHNSNELLVKFASSVMDTAHWGNVSLVN
jgi:hypothetical protein